MYLSGCVDEVFKRSIRDMGFDDATMAYYEEDYSDEAYDEFWDDHKQLAANGTAVRNSFYREERTLLHGFCDSERENTDDADLETDIRDCLYMMRICKRWHNVDVEKFLTATKREYLPMMIRFFIATPKNDILAEQAACKAVESLEKLIPFRSLSHAQSNRDPFFYLSFMAGCGTRRTRSASRVFFSLARSYQSQICRIATAGRHPVVAVFIHMFGSSGASASSTFTVRTAILSSCPPAQ